MGGAALDNNGGQHRPAGQDVEQEFTCRSAPLFAARRRHRLYRTDVHLAVPLDDRGDADTMEKIEEACDELSEMFTAAQDEFNAPVTLN